MPDYSVCGKPTQLHVMGKPICVPCDAASPEERRIRGKQSKRLPERAATAVDIQSRSTAA
jgi:hypothetical protein